MKFGGHVVTVRRRKGPKDGARRRRGAFLFLPKQIAGETRWLEFAKWIEVYYYNKGGVSPAGEMIGSTGEGWVVERWVNPHKPAKHPRGKRSAKGQGELL